MLIGGLQKSSLIDYPEKISAIVFTQGCNFNCPYCHNPELLKNSSENVIDESLLFSFLKSRVGKLDGVVITGGEPTLYFDLPEFVFKIKQLGFMVKLDTNGSNPIVLKKMFEDGLLDYVAMDVKAPIEKYQEFFNSKNCIDNVLKTIEIIMNSGVDYEFRTTVEKSLLSFDDFVEIGEMIKGAKKYYLQRFVSTKTLDKSLINGTTYNDFEFEEIINILKNNVEKVYLR